MSKRDLKKYISDLTKTQLEEQLLELYDKFKEVNTYYNFVFKPNEKNLVKDAKLKISNEYFPVRGKRPKMRRSVAQKYIKHFITLGVDAYAIADIMLYSIEIAQVFTAEKTVTNELFFKSMLSSFQQVISFLIEKEIFNDFKSRVVAVNTSALDQNWANAYAFNAIIERFDY